MKQIEVVYLGRKIKRLPDKRWRVVSTGDVYHTKRDAQIAVAGIIFPYPHTGIPIRGNLLRRQS